MGSGQYVPTPVRFAVALPARGAVTVRTAHWRVFLVGAKFTVRVQLAFAAKVWPAQLSEVMVYQSNGPICPQKKAAPIASEIGPAGMGLMFVTVNVAEAVVPTRIGPKSFERGAILSRASPLPVRYASA